MRRRILFSLILVCSAWLAGCTTNPATGERSFTAFMSPADEKRVGAEEHPKLVQQFGGAYADTKLQAYVDRVGQSLGQYTETPGERFTFVVLDDEGVNAFALPGGYVHVTRGLLALADNEAELAGVLAHELGHVTARHSAQRYSKGVAANIGLGVLGVAGAIAGVPGIANDLAGLGAQAYLQSYSRDQELEADRLAIRYMTRAGYDPDAMATFFRKLDAYTRLQARMVGDPESGDRFDIMASHPRTAEREQQARGQAATANRTAARLDKEAYLSHIDGLVYGDSPAQGIRRGRDFLHPTLRIGFRVPPGFVLHNSPQQVVARGPGNAVLLFDGARPDAARSAPSAQAYLTRSWLPQIRLTDVGSFVVNGMDAATGVARLNARQGPVDARFVAIREGPDRIYRFVFLSPPGMTSRLEPGFKETAYSFRRLTAQEAAEIKPLRVRIAKVTAADSIASLAQGMPFGTFNRQMFEVLNGLNGGQTLRAGDLVKVIGE